MLKALASNRAKLPLLVLSDGGRHDSGEPFERHHSRGSQLKFKSRNDARELLFIRNCPDLFLSRSPQEDKSLFSRSFVFQKLCVFFQVKLLYVEHVASKATEAWSRLIQGENCETVLQELFYLQGLALDQVL